MDLSLTAEAFTAMPAHLADGQALDRLDSRAIFVRPIADSETLADFVQDVARIPLRGPVLLKKFSTGDTRKAGAVALHSIGPTGEVELVAVATPGVWSRGVIRFLARWIFWDLEIRRLVLRIRDSDRTTQTYAYRLGFRFEGRARRWFADDEDAQLWTMLPSECAWL